MSYRDKMIQARDEGPHKIPNIAIELAGQADEEIEKAANREEDLMCTIEDLQVIASTIKEV